MHYPPLPISPLKQSRTINTPIPSKNLSKMISEIPIVLPTEYMTMTKTRWAAEGRDQCGALLSHAGECACMGCRPETPTPKTPFDRLFGSDAESELFSQGAWWSIFGDDMLALEEKVVAEYRATKSQTDAARDAVIAAADRKNKVERVAIREGACRTRHGPAEIRRLAQPCKFLYNCQGTPARPTTMHITTECWSHESGVCPWAHPAMPARAAMKLKDGTVVPAAAAIPADPLWDAHWATDRLYRPTTESRFSDLARPAPRPAPRPARR